MKKLFAFFVVMVLLLTACAQVTDPSGALHSSNIITTLSAPTTPGIVPTTALTTVPTTTPTTGAADGTTTPTIEQTTTVPTTIKPPLAPIVKPTGPAYVYNDERVEMMNSKIFRALKYLGYDRAKELEHKGLLFEEGYTGKELDEAYTNGELQNYPLTQIFYSNGIYGTAIRPAKPGEESKTGNVPDVDQFIEKGIVCTSFVDYYYIPYLRNIEGVKVGHIISAYNKTGTSKPQVYEGWIVDHWTVTAELLVEQGFATVQRFDFADSQPPAEVDEPSEGYIRYEEMFETLPIGTLIRFGRFNNRNTHFAVYAGTYNGIHYMIHMGSNRGPEISSISDSFREDRDLKSYPLAFYVIEGACEEAA